MSSRERKVRSEVSLALNTLVAIPNVSASCPVNTCPVPQPDGSVGCWPCLPALAPNPEPVPALDTWAALALGLALVAAGLKGLRHGA
jgi:hypothetical protein